MLWWTSYGVSRGWESGSRKVDDLDSALPPRISVEQGRAVVVYGDRIVGRQAESC